MYSSGLENSSNILEIMHICDTMKKHEEYINSPYSLSGIKERLYTTKDDETLTVDPETGQYYTVRKVSKDKKVLHDELVYTKLFHGNMGQFMELPHSSFKVLMYAMCTVRAMSQVVVLNAADVCLACGMGNSTFYNAVYDLLNRKILSKKLGSSIEFWFDPNVFFNGNRIRISKQVIVSNHD